MFPAIPFCPPSPGIFVCPTQISGVCTVISPSVLFRFHSNFSPVLGIQAFVQLSCVHPLFLVTHPFRQGINLCSQDRSIVALGYSFILQQAGCPALASHIIKRAKPFLHHRHKLMTFPLLGMSSELRGLPGPLSLTRALRSQLACAGTPWRDQSLHRRHRLVWHQLRRSTVVLPLPRTELFFAV